MNEKGNIFAMMLVFLFVSFTGLYSLSPTTSVLQLCSEWLKKATWEKKREESVVLSHSEKVELDEVISFLEEKQREVGLSDYFQSGVCYDRQIRERYLDLKIGNKKGALFFLLLYSFHGNEFDLNRLMKSKVFMKVAEGFTDFTTYFEYIRDYAIFVSECYQQGVDHAILPVSLKWDASDSVSSAFLKLIFSLHKSRKSNSPYPLDAFETQLLSLISFKSGRIEYLGNMHYLPVDERFYIPSLCGSIVFYKELSSLKEKVFPLLEKREIKFILAQEGEEVFSQMVPYLNPAQDSGRSILFFNVSFSQMVDYFYQAFDRGASLIHYLAVNPLVSVSEIKRHLPVPVSRFSFYIFLNFNPNQFSKEEHGKILLPIKGSWIEEWYDTWLKGQFESMEEQYQLIQENQTFLNFIPINKRGNWMRFMAKKKELYAFLRKESHQFLYLFRFPSDPQFKQDVQRSYSQASVPVSVSQEDLSDWLSSLEKLTLLGRTIYGFCPNMNKWVAFKFQKKGETAKDLIQANAFHHVLQKHLDRNVPVAKGVFKIKEGRSVLASFFSNNNQSDFEIFYQNEQGESFFRVYEVDDEGFFRYPYDPNASIDQVAYGLMESVRTFGLLWRKGYYLHSLSAMFHEEGRLYLPATFLLEDGEMGSIESWDTQAINTPDIRRSGLMDMEDGLFDISTVLDEVYKKSTLQLLYRSYSFEERNSFFKLNSLISILLLCDLSLFHLFNEGRLSREKLVDTIKEYYQILFQTVCQTTKEQTVQIMSSFDFKKYINEAIVHTSPSSSHFQEMLSKKPYLKYKEGLTEQGYKSILGSRHTNLGGFNEAYPIGSFVDLMVLFLSEMYICLSQQSDLKQSEVVGKGGASEEIGIQVLHKNNYIQQDVLFSS